MDLKTHAMDLGQYNKGIGPWRMQLFTKYVCTVCTVCTVCRGVNDIFLMIPFLF
jgi:hypothetical protein